MSPLDDSTRYLDVDGIRQDQPQEPPRHPVDQRDLALLSAIAAVGVSGSAERLSWEVLVRVHGFAEVLRAAARCLHLQPPGGLVPSDQAQRVLDGRQVIGPPRGPGAFPPRRPRTAC